MVDQLESMLTKQVSPDLAGTIEAARAATIQSQVTSPAQAGLGMLWWMARAGTYIPSWWSPARDQTLRNFWKGCDHLAGAVYSLEAKMTAIPFTIVARDQSVQEHVEQAEALSRIIYGAAQYGEGWPVFFGRFVEDLLTQDNGAFAEVIGPGPKDGPLTGSPITIAHLDAGRCQRTGNAEFPVIYNDISGRLYKLHYSRVLYMAQMSSPIAEMFGVGFSSVSRCINVSQTLADILAFKQEKLGSRPHRALGITQGGLDPHDVQDAFTKTEAIMDSQQLSRYSKIVLVGSQSLPESDFKLIDFASLPDGFDEETSITLGMAAIALAFGVDARELFPAMTSGATRADALLSHLKQRGKGPGQIIQAMESAFNFKYLPPHLSMVFDFQDDAQDRQAADIALVRANARAQDSTSGAVSPRIQRERMLDSAELTRSQFERLELQDGRLADGTTVLALFYSEDPGLKEYLDLGVDDPLDLDGNDLLAMQALIREKIALVTTTLANEQSRPKKYPATQALYALLYLEKYYLNPMEAGKILMGDGADVGNLPFGPFGQPAAPGAPGQPGKPGAPGQYVDPRARGQNPANPNTRRETDTGQNTPGNVAGTHPDDRATNKEAEQWMPF